MVMGPRAYRCLPFMLMLAVAVPANARSQDYYEGSGEFVGDFMWHDDVSGNETNEFWVSTFFVNAHGNVASTRTAIEIFREMTSQVEVCRREYDVSGTKQP